jgi:hypothetical protein
MVKVRRNNSKPKNPEWDYDTTMNLESISDVAIFEREELINRLEAHSDQIMKAYVKWKRNSEWSNYDLALELGVTESSVNTWDVGHPPNRWMLYRLFLFLKRPRI